VVLSNPGRDRPALSNWNRGNRCTPSTSSATSSPAAALFRTRPAVMPFVGGHLGAGEPAKSDKAPQEWRA